MVTDLSKRIIYENEGGGISIVIPCDCGLTVEEIAAKDVPTGRFFAIIDVDQVPTDRLQRAGWTVEPSDLTDGAGK